MKHLIFNELLILRKDKKSQLLGLLLLVGAIAFSFAVSTFNLGNLPQAKQEEVYNIQGSMDTVSEMERISENPSKKYATLLKQESLLTRQQMTLIVELDNTYLEKEAALNDLQLEITEDPEFADSLPYIPPRYELEGIQVTNRYLSQHQLARATTNLNGVNYTIYFSFFLILGLSLLVALFSTDILLSDQNHTTVIQGFPVSKTKRIWAKIITFAILIYLLVLVSLLIGFITMSLRYYQGSLNYPVSIYLFQTYRALPFTTYLMILAVMMPFVIIFGLLFAALLNLVTKNSYLTLFIQLACFFIPYFIPQLSRYTFWLPFDYLNLKRVLTGELAFNSQLPQLDLVTGLLSLSSWILFLTLGLQFAQRERTRI